MSSSSDAGEASPVGSFPWRLREWVSYVGRREASEYLEVPLAAFRALLTDPDDNPYSSAAQARLDAVFPAEGQISTLTLAPPTAPDVTQHTCPAVCQTCSQPISIAAGAPAPAPEPVE